MSILRAALADIARYGRGQRPLGASTITQQLVRHFLLTNEVSVSRKIKEALLAYRIENQLSKNRILEIYLNEIYLGAGAYGVAAAAETYFGKTLDRAHPGRGGLSRRPAEGAQQLQSAAPSRSGAGSPRLGARQHGGAGLAYAQAEADSAKAQPLDAQARAEPTPSDAGYFAEEVRRELVDRFGEKTVYEGGLIVRTSYVPVYQAMAETSVSQRACRV